MLSPSEQSPNRPQGQSYPTPPRRESKATPEKAVTTGGKPPLSAKAVLGYKVPYAVCGVLLLLTLLCALYDSQNFVIWLFGK
ncbi:hypothetical protein AGDE_15530 [Angomonas deanei]|uniref:Uncharacterized protein n=1 Tax=Angomonas deanei TaxID=59799 RepID=A0A7G2CR79_9TRYP|nr:hypothetical protein AGDE_15530 [Angomonas deanei]CAD2221511.1 hypothetical protein, conserved [Angomonas deanei]|eukprot:EPY18913.1 hypothetical protein AGDE_15530 [Angomonas deanei]